MIYIKPNRSSSRIVAVQNLSWIVHRSYNLFFIHQQILPLVFLSLFAFEKLIEVVVYFFHFIQCPLNPCLISFRLSFQICQPLAVVFLFQVDLIFLFLFPFMKILLCFPCTFSFVDFFFFPRYLLFFTDFISLFLGLV